MFYVIFYAVLSAFFGGMLVVFFQTLDVNQPKWQQEKSLIGNNPGLGFRPMPPESNVDSTLIWYKATDQGNYGHWAKALNKFLQGDLALIIANIFNNNTISKRNLIKTTRIIHHNFQSRYAENDLFVIQ